MRLLAWLCLLALTSCFVDRPTTRLDKQGVQIRRVEAYEAAGGEASTVVLAPGDFVITGPHMRVVIGGLRRTGDARGAVLEATYEGMSDVDSIALLSPRLYVGGVERRIRVQRLYVHERAGAIALRVEGAVELEDRVISVEQELALGRVPGTLSVATRSLTLHPDGVADVRLGARISWGGAHPFVPGIGELPDENWHRADWVGSEGATGSVVFGYDDERLSLRAVYEHRAPNVLLLHTDVTEAESHGLAGGKARYAKSVLTLSASALADSVRRLGMWRGAPYREAWVNLPYRPEGAAVELRDPERGLLLTARPDAQGRAVLPLVSAAEAPPSEYSAVATAFGHAPSDPFIWPAAESPQFSLVIPRGGRIRVRARDADGGRPLSARVRIVSADEHPLASLGPDYRASGAGDTLIALAGEAAVSVPPGKYRVLVSHGPEWTLHEAEVTVSETYSPRVDAELEHQVDAGAWLACDLHVHAAPSPDSQVTLEDRLATLAAEGVRFAVPTDHNHVTDYAPVAQLLSLEDFATVTGVEVTTMDPGYGHFNAYPYPLDPARPNNGALDVTHIEPGPLFRALRALDPELVVQINHPRHEGGIGYFSVMSFDAKSGDADPRFSADFDAIEVFNGFDLARPERVEQVFQDFLAVLVRGQRVVATGSSDSHQVRYQLAGYPRTYAFVPPEAGADPRAVVRAIKAGASFVTSGPFLEASIAGGGPGATVAAPDGKVTLAVRVQAASWIDVDALDVFVGGEKVLERAIPPPARPRKGKLSSAVRLDVSDIVLPVERDTFVIVRARGSRPNDAFFGRAGITPLAFTNPIFVDVDGDGVWRVTK